ncbi:PREDICTED: taste receptor type 2 member 19-like [Miniopterus natalensis]|uniref:taste receptor type 2 member 19-like n=1 Tax=Miniopterus natalensis TaxID=291302 RepID=UPI0007A6FF4E|nr:PREDICTED: taste receptor type 2 member 19-like [Miniopterus natalensis]
MTLQMNILSILVMIQFVLGNFANGFIALVNGIDWVKRQKLSCADRILTALAVSRIGFLWVIVFNWYASGFNLAFYGPEIRHAVHIAWVVSNHFSLWLATSLSIFYFLKITNFSSLLFLHLKWRAKKVVVTIMWGTLVFLVCHIAVLSIHDKMQTDEQEGNRTWETSLGDSVKLSNVIINALVNFIPFTMSLTAFLLLISSLWKHLKKMHLSGRGFQDPSTKVHIRAMQTVISFLLLLAIYFLAQVTSVWNSNTVQHNSVYLLCKSLAILYPSGHSFILIWGNKKLRQAFLSYLWQLRCRLKERK